MEGTPSRRLMMTFVRERQISSTMMEEVADPEPA
jgi:hypothetical protein